MLRSYTFCPKEWPKRLTDWRQVLILSLISLYFFLNYNKLLVLTIYPQVFGCVVGHILSRWVIFKTFQIICLLFNASSQMYFVAILNIASSDLLYFISCNCYRNVFRIVVNFIVWFSFSSSSVIIFVLFWWISYGFFVCSVSLDLMIFFRFLTLGFFEWRSAYNTPQYDHITSHVTAWVSQSIKGRIGSGRLWKCGL